MPNPDRFPNYVRGYAAVGVPALRKAVGALESWQLTGKLDTSVDDANALAREIVAKVESPDHVLDELPPKLQDVVGTAIGVGTKAEWKRKHPVTAKIRAMPDYLQPCWENDLVAVLEKKAAAPKPKPRALAPRPQAAAWPKGKRIRSGALTFVLIPGGTFSMGLSPAEQKELQRVARAAGPEALEHARALVKRARPVRTVTVAPFLCAQTPLLERGAVKRFRADEVVAALAGRRLLSEAEWEFIARAGGTRAWLSGDEDPADWARRALKLPAERHPFGVLGLGWGEWVDDSWHPTYAGAPKTSAAWKPNEHPGTVRGGGLAVWPWQVGGEALLCHATHRDPGGEETERAVRPALDLPPR